jgi:hypothetical protein
METKTYWIYQTEEFQRCYYVEANSIEEAEKLHDWGHSHISWSAIGDMYITHIEEGTEDDD